jgi:hypothetical protein
VEIDVGVLGRFRVTVDGEDLTERVQPSQRAILGLLSVAREPVAKADICRIVGVAPSSLDPQLSRLRTALRADKPVHRGRAPTSGFIALDRDVVATDVDDFLERVSAGAAAHARGDDREALPLLLAADNLWRGPAFDGLLLIDDPASQTSVKELSESLVAEWHRCRELAAWCWLAGTRSGLDSERLLRWAGELRDSAACWSAATRAVLERDGTHAAAVVAERWRELASIDSDAASTGMYGEVVRLLGGTGRARTPMPGRVTELLRSAETHRLHGRWDEAEVDFTTAADEAETLGDGEAEAEVCLTMARITWDPSRYGGKLEHRLRRLLDTLPGNEHLLRARIVACLAGGLYQDGSVDPETTTPYARQALELAGELQIEDTLTAAEVLSHARKALIDVDLPEVQLERSRWIMSLAKGSDYYRSQGLLAAIIDLLLLDRVDEARGLSLDYREIGDRTSSEYHRYFSATLDGLWAIYDERWDDFTAASADAESLGMQFGGVAVAETVHGQRLWAAYRRGDIDFVREALPLIDAVADTDRPIPIWEITGALFSTVVDEPDEACRRLDRVARATGEFRNLPRGPLRIGALALASLVCAELASQGFNVRSSAQGLHEQLLANNAEGVPIGWPAIYIGSKQLYVDMAAKII